jgi:PPOX class probable F420-dependent enzyme
VLPALTETKDFHMVAQVPDSHQDLLDRRVFVTVTTLLPDGSPHSTIVWVDYEGDLIRINTTNDRQKYRDLQRDPRVSITWLDPDNPYRWMVIRGTVTEMTEEGAVDHIHALAQKYEGRRYYGDFSPAERANQETRVLVRIRPEKVITSAR